MLNIIYEIAGVKIYNKGLNHAQVSQKNHAACMKMWRPLLSCVDNSAGPPPQSQTEPCHSYRSVHDDQRYDLT